MVVHLLHYTRFWDVGEARSNVRSIRSFVRNGIDGPLSNALPFSCRERITQTAKMRTISGAKRSAGTADCVKSRNGGAITPCEARFPRHLTAKVERQERSSGRNRRGVEGPKHFHKQQILLVWFRRAHQSNLLTPGP